MIREPFDSERRRTRILTLIPPGEDSPRLEAFLARSELEVVRTETAQETVETLSQSPFDAIVAGLPVPELSVGRLVSVVHDLGRPDSPLPLILLARKAQLEAARVFESASVQVVGRHESEDRLRRIIADALGVATRLAVRIPVRLEVGVEAGPTLHFCETRNLSRSGMLVSSSHPLPIGTVFDFELMLPRTLDPLTGHAEVVRQSDPRKEDTTGFGARFLDLAFSDSARLDAFVRDEAVSH